MNTANNSAQANTDATFRDLLKSELQLLASLKSLMLEEKASLEQSKIDNLIGLAENKQRVLEALETASKQRQMFLNKYARGKSGLDKLDDFLSRSNHASFLKEKFTQLQNALQDCKDLNDANAKIIAMSQRHVERNLNILKGVDSNAMVYTSKGSTEATQSRLSGVKA